MPVNQNQYLFGPGPLRRAGAGVATGPPLQGLVKVAIQGLGFPARLSGPPLQGLVKVGPVATPAPARLSGPPLQGLVKVGPVATPAPARLSGPPLQGLVKVAIQGLGLGAIAAITYKVSFHDPTKRDIDEFYAKHNNS
eukprot:CAMPEP_0178976958 /NCGR_PEP_ID=MMETSP0789-20121207/24184_1 /TAXON_ID=3005 /ORGANISM="Rhizosolenia setigera, Strain CCMP 1694" /LENGTH=137 /DNA_ID=CAMNT_0020666227 /DNA_START=10 /DNA_END=423 /DNA_ORIENTATION=+